MIADRASGIEVQSNLQGERIAMQIDQNAMAHVMQILTDLYSDTELACIREYSTNGWDAHVESGSTDRPIEVTTPTNFSPFLTVRDYGVGLSVEDIHSIYSQYGASTKRGTNDQNGMLGLGCKSALTYCDQFTVESVQNGTKVTVVVARDEDGAGSMTVLDTSASDEHDGTTIIVPCRHGNSMLAKAEKFFSVWDEGTVLLNGKPPQRFEGLRLTDDLYIIEDDQSYVVMGGVTYPAEFNLPGAATQYRHGPRGYRDYCNVHVMAFVPIGAVNFVPSREALMDTKNTKATLAAVEQAFATGVKGAIQREVDAATSPQEAVRIIIKWNKYIAGNSTVASYSYKGQSIPTEFESNGIQTSPFSSYRRRGVASRQRSVVVHDWPGTVFVHGFTPAKFTAQHKDKLLKWVTDEGLEGITQFAMLPGLAPTSPFIDSTQVVSWDTIKAIKLDVTTSSYGRPSRIPGSFDIWLKDGSKSDAEWKHGVPGDDLNTKAPLFWHNGNRWECERFADILAANLPKFTLVCLPANRIQKFCRDVPKAERAQKGCDDAYAKWCKTLSRDERIGLGITDACLTRALSPLDAKRVNDPDLKAAIRCAKTDVKKLRDKRQSFRSVVHVTADKLVQDWKNPLDKYPLYDEDYLAKHPGHVYGYLNHVHAGTIA